MTKSSPGLTIVSALIGVSFGVLSLIGGAQLVLITVFMPLDRIREILTEPGAADTLPPMVYFVMRHFWSIGFSILTICCLTSVSAFGVCRRKEWARMFMPVALALQAAAVLLSSFAVASIIQSAGGPPRLPGAFGRIPHAYVAICLLPGFLFAAACGVYVYTLTRPHIRTEFS